MNYEVKYPRHAETVSYLSYVIVENYKSRYAKDAVMERVVGLKCPGCHFVTKIKLEHGEDTQCSKCDLKMQLFGNGLHIWRSLW